MIKQYCITMMRPVNNEGGFTMIVALILLMLLTIIGVTAINTSTTETMISSAEEMKRTAFYAAESGVEHATAMLRSQFVARNQSEINAALAAGTVPQPRWSFALNGHNDVTTTKAQPQPQPGTDSHWLDRFNAGVPWIVNANLGNGYTYNVRVWNNADKFDATSPDPPEQTDTDSLIIVGAIATAPPPRISRAAIEVVLNGGIDQSSATAAYTAQAGAGAGKNYNAADVNAISATNLGLMGTNANLK
jgi:Tfp pilus assembly protein PilX